MSLVKFRVTGAKKMLLVRKDVSATQRQASREGNIAFVFLRQDFISTLLGGGGVQGQG